MSSSCVTYIFPSGGVFQTQNNPIISQGRSPLTYNIGYGNIRIPFQVLEPADSLPQLFAFFGSGVNPSATGPLSFNLISVNSNYSISSTDVMVVFQSSTPSGQICTLPSSPTIGRFLRIINCSPNNITINPNGNTIGDYPGGASSYSLPQNSSIDVNWDQPNVTWRIA